MNGFMRPEQVKRIKEQYPAGTRLCCDSMPDDPRPIEPGTLGTVAGVDDAGSIMMKWDNGRSLSLVPGVDSFHIVGQKQEPVREQETVKLTVSEERLHGQLMEIAKVMAAQANNGERDFDIDELLEGIDLRTPIVHALSDMIAGCPGIEHSAVHDIGIPFQNVIRVFPAEMQEEMSEVSEPVETEEPEMSM